MFDIIALWIQCRHNCSSTNVPYEIYNCIVNKRNASATMIEDLIRDIHEVYYNKKKKIKHEDNRSKAEVG